MSLIRSLTLSKPAHTRLTQTVGLLLGENMELTKEHFELIPKIDISTPEKLAQFKAWQNDDGTIEGLRKLYEAQQSAERTGEQSG